MILKPREGVLVRDPVTMLPLKAEGQEVVDNRYWQRRINDGDVEVLDKLPKSKIKPSEA